VARDDLRCSPLYYFRGHIGELQHACAFQKLHIPIWEYGADIPWKQDIDQYFEAEVLPFAPDAWMDREKDKIGYEIPFTKYYYEYKPLRDLSLIMKDIYELEEQTEALLKEIKDEK